MRVLFCFVLCACVCVRVGVLGFVLITNMRFQVRQH